MDEKKPTLADVDGSTPGRAILLQIDMEDPNGTRSGPYYTDYTENENGCTDPYASCEQMWKSVKGDWPTHERAIVGNARAKYLIWARHMKEIGITDRSPQDYLDLSAGE